MQCAWFSVEYCWCSVDMRKYCAAGLGRVRVIEEILLYGHTSTGYAVNFSRFCFFSWQPGGVGDRFAPNGLGCGYPVEPSFRRLPPSNVRITHTPCLKLTSACRSLVEDRPDCGQQSVFPEGLFDESSLRRERVVATQHSGSISRYKDRLEVRR